MPGQRAGDAGKNQEKKNDTVVAANSECRCDERGDAWRMDRIDLAIAAADAEVRWNVSLHVGAIVTLPMIVLDAEVAVFQKALGNDQIVRFIAGRH